MRPPGTLVSKTFRDNVLQTYPKLKGDWRYLAFFDLVLFGAFIEGAYRPDKVITHQGILEALGMAPNTGSKAFQSGRFIDTFNDDVLRGKLVVGPYSHLDRKARTVSISQLAPTFRAALDHELQNFHGVDDNDLVHFVSGDAWKRTTPTDIRSTDKAKAALLPGAIPEAQRLVDYLNELPVNVFTSTINDHMSRAMQIASKIQNTVVRRHQLALLHKINSQPKPFYGGSAEDKTVRIFSRNPSVLQLRNELKHALTSTWTTFDLRSAQLAIIAKDWHISSLTALLQDPSKNVWKELSSSLQGVAPDVAKSVTKTAMYAIAYGASEATVRSELKKGLEDADVRSDSVDIGPFFAHSVVKDLFLFREAVLAVVREQRGASDCFGRRLKCKTRGQTRSVIAQLSQAQEMQLLLPALHLAEKRPQDFRIMLWEHDGFSVHFRRDAQRNESTKRALVKAVNDECKRLGYLTELVEK